MAMLWRLMVFWLGETTKYCLIPKKFLSRLIFNPFQLKLEIMLN